MRVSWRPWIVFDTLDVQIANDKAVKRNGPKSVAFKVGGNRKHQSSLGAHEVGIATEMAVSELTDLPINETYSREGDEGWDFEFGPPVRKRELLPNGKVRYPKQTRKFLIDAKGREGNGSMLIPYDTKFNKGRDYIYVGGHTDAIGGGQFAVALCGWLYGYEVLKFMHGPERLDWMSMVNYHMPLNYLPRTMESLVQLIRSK